MLRWARERLQRLPEQVAEKVPVKLEKLVLWEQGEARPSFRQAQILAKILRIPFGYLFLSEPPRGKPQIPDLRTVRDATHAQLSVNFLDTLNDALRKQDWYREYIQQEQPEPLPFVGRCSIHKPPESVAADISKTLSIDDGFRRSVRSWEEFLRCLIEKAEQTGILVMRSSVVGNNTHRPLSVDEFRGFAISDPFAPLVFIWHLWAKGPSHYRYWRMLHFFSFNRRDMIWV